MITKTPLPELTWRIAFKIFLDFGGINRGPVTAAASIPDPT